MEFEYIEHRKGLPFKLFLVSIGYRSHHFHAHFEAIYVLKGCVKIQLAQSFHMVQEGQLFLINPYEIHSIENVEEVEQKNNLLLIIQVTTHAHVFNKRRLSQIHFSQHLLSANNNELVQTLLHIYSKNCGSRPSTEYYLNGLMQIFIANLLDNVPYEIYEHGMLSNQSDVFKRLEFIIDYVENHHGDKINLEDIADKLHLSKYYLSHFIKQQLGISFRNYLNNVRLTNAISLLINTEQSIMNISILSGFSDQKYLNAIIKEKYNCSANTLRKTTNQQLKVASINAPLGSVHLPFDQEEAMALIKIKQQHCHIISTTS